MDLKCIHARHYTPLLMDRQNDLFCTFPGIKIYRRRSGTQRPAAYAFMFLTAQDPLSNYTALGGPMPQLRRIALLH